MKCLESEKNYRALLLFEEHSQLVGTASLPSMASYDIIVKSYGNYLMFWNNNSGGLRNFPIKIFLSKKSYQEVTTPHYK